MPSSMRPWLVGSLGTLLVACGSSQDHSNVPDEPREPAVIVVGRPTIHHPSTNAPQEVAADEPDVPLAQPRQTTPDAELAEVVLDPRKSTWAPRARMLLVTELQGLEALLNSTPLNAPDRPKILRRLAENYLELKNAALQDEKRLVASLGASRSRETIKAEIAKNDKLAQASQKRALVHYESLIKNFPTYCDTPNAIDPNRGQGCIDDALYFTALEYLRLDSPQETRKYCMNLIRSFPVSPWLPHTYLIFADFFRMESEKDPTQLDYAQKAYEKVLQFAAPQNETYGYALYRLAQVEAKKQDYTNALSHISKAGEFAINYSVLRSSPLLGDAVRRDIVPIYAMAGASRKAESFFKGLTTDPPGSSQQLVPMLDALVRAYVEANKRVEAADVCRSFSGDVAALPACGQSIAPTY